MKLPRGFSLIEVTVALGVAAFALVAVFGLLPVGINSSDSAIRQTEANAIFSSVLEDLRSTPSGATSSTYGLTLPPDPTVPPASPSTLYLDETGRISAARDATSRYRLMVTFLGAPHAFAPVQTLLQVTWPAEADPVNARGKALLFGALQQRK